MVSAGPVSLGWSKQGGFELILRDGSRGDELYARVMAAGAPYGIGPGAPIHVERVESGLLSCGGDNTPDSNPLKAGMQHFVDIESDVDYIGTAALPDSATRRLRRCRFFRPPRFRTDAGLAPDVSLSKPGGRVMTSTSAGHAMTSAMDDFIQGLPKAELHVHLEGTLEPEFLFECARRNGIDLPYETPADVVAAYDFHDLPSFLAIYYPAMDVLRTEQDFFDLTYAYFERAAAENVIYVEPFFDPQAHTARGVSFETVITGIHRAQDAARDKLGVASNLIMCFLRDMSAESAAEHLDMALPFKDWLIGVGLDSDEKDNPPAKFAEVFARARSAGLKLTMHCDVNQKDIVGHLWECLDLVQVDRIDHGINALDDERLLAEIARRGLGLTVCPISNRFVVQNLTGDEIRRLTDAGVPVTINSDDPAYFRAYMNENFSALARDAGFTRDELGALARNAFEICWAEESLQRDLLGRLDGYLLSAAGRVGRG